jgi:hypothetical protein
MKRVEREDFRIRVVIVADRASELGLPVDGQIVSGRVEMVVEPRRLGDFGFGIMSDSLVTRDVQGAYQRRTDELAAELRRLPQVAKATVEFTESVTCSHCGYPWEQLTAEDIAKYPDVITPDDVVGLPQCCDEAQVEWRAEQKAGAL